MIETLGFHKYTFFWNGPFSQWWTESGPMKIDGLYFNCCEQYMMYKKAVTFSDPISAQAILESESPREQKALGRGIKNFNPMTWNAVARDIVFRANMVKFTSDMDLWDKLYHTNGTLLVEASPYDTIWGIGLDEATAKNKPIDEWRGTNWLGQILTEVRIALLCI